MPVNDAEMIILRCNALIDSLTAASDQLEKETKVDSSMLLTMTRSFIRSIERTKERYQQALDRALWRDQDSVA